MKTFKEYVEEKMTVEDFPVDPECEIVQREKDLTKDPVWRKQHRDRCRKCFQYPMEKPLPAGTTT